MKNIVLTLLFTTLISCSAIGNTNQINNFEISNGEEPKIRVKISNINNQYRGDLYNINGLNINEVMLEEYLYSVVASEMPRSFGIEALKAQAIAARTYAIYSMSIKGEKIFDVYDTERSQAYKGIMVENAKAKEAVDSTRGLILTYEGKPIEALYTSSCGGKTLSAKQYFGKEVPYLQSVEDFSSDKNWKNSIKFEDLKSKLGITSETIVGLDDFIYFDNDILTKKQLKIKLGLPSPIYDIELKDGIIYFKGMGYGHCVGMSQYGSNYLAKNGYTYDEILKHYYKGVKIKKVY